MTDPTLASIADVCEVTVLRGVDSGERPDVVFEVPHGATRAADYDRLLAALRADYDPDLRAFFFVNTDVGAPEVALRAAEQLVARQPDRTACVVRCLVPRTFLDCNRVIAPDAVGHGSAAGAVTPGLQPWVQDADDRRLLLHRYAAYRGVVDTAFAATCGRGGVGLMVHSYAPRSVEVEVDAAIVARLRAAYAADQVDSWPLRSAVDCIVADLDGALLANEVMLDCTTKGYAELGIEATAGATYPLHPSTLAHQLAVRYPGRTLCVELRRDLLVTAWTPFEDMHTDPARVERMAGPLAAAAAAGLVGG